MSRSNKNSRSQNKKIVSLKKSSHKKTLSKKSTPKKAAAKKSAKTIKKQVAKPKSSKLNSARINRPKALAKKAVVPNLSLPSTEGKNVNLTELKGKKIVLYFYPKDLTPGCTVEGHDFSKLKQAFKSKNAVIYGVSRDTIALHQKFKAKECFTIDLLSDEGEKLCNSFGVIKDKNMYGKKVRGIERSTFLIGEDGKIIKEWRGVKVAGHAQDVLDSIGIQDEAE